MHTYIHAGTYDDNRNEWKISSPSVSNPIVDQRSILYNPSCENDVASLKDITYIVADDNNQIFRCCGNDGMYVCIVYMYVYMYVFTCRIFN